MPERVDVAVIGAGVLGCAVARELSRYKTDTLVLERAHDVGEGSSKANSGIVHAGFQPRAKSLKGRSCVEGNTLMRQLTRELDVPFLECGGLMVAFSTDGEQKLRDKMERGIANGAQGLRIIDGDEAREMEPRLSAKVTAALDAPTTAVISPFDLVLALAENAAENGVRFRFGARVECVERTGYGWMLWLEGGDAVEARYVVNAAGDDAAPLDSQVSSVTYEVKPRMGDYLVFDKQEPSRAIRHVIYQAADSDEGGTLITPTVDGNLLAGPTSRNTRWFSNTASTASGLEQVRRVARKVIPDIDFSQVIRNFAGARANIVNVPKELKDFVVRVSAPGFVSTLGIKNPGMTSSPALARLAVKLIEGEGLRLEANPFFEGARKRYVPFLQRSGAEQHELLATDDRFGRVVCRCESVTEGDVARMLARPLPPTTLAGVKRRLRCGMGRCQGQYCEPRLLEQMASSWNVRPWRVPACEYGGRVVVGAVKS